MKTHERVKLKLLIIQCEICDFKDFLRSPIYSSTFQAYAKPDRHKLTCNC